ncbi:nuclear transport factor 2 family protein [Hymenobacter busanensis]|uniref:Nuclear transport factor 2 family protein n=1 Tax=Hymenobacter busanensis TaxID=2607656 RepID=A0A7L4ZZM5_9BACT|nr:nuclear transport factor 2 family protein [Hymenobacter busanensis]KAA9333100.1 nuclear transport factor 2 family protein [Hymenobacter busanensis]QHJ08225.1 DUF4440 domain-containing protein [Hymenobacter busanensis]
MKTRLLLLLLLLTALATPTQAQRRPMSDKARKAKIAAAAAARTKAERAARAEAAARAAAFLPVSDGPDATELLRIDGVLADATLRSDAETITHLLADEYVAVNSKGLVTGKADVLAAIANDAAQCDINKGFEYVVRVYGNTGLVIHNTSFRGQLDGTSVTGEYRVTRFFIKRNGKWLVAASQTTHVTPAPLVALNKGAAKRAFRDKKKNRSSYVADRH